MSGSFSWTLVWYSAERKKEWVTAWTDNTFIKDGLYLYGYCYGASWCGFALSRACLMLALTEDVLKQEGWMELSFLGGNV